VQEHKKFTLRYRPAKESLQAPPFSFPAGSSKNIFVLPSRYIGSPKTDTPSMPYKRRRKPMQLSRLIFGFFVEPCGKAFSSLRFHDWPPLPEWSAGAFFKSRRDLSHIPLLKRGVF
jgi:hypothetical protein